MSNLTHQKAYLPRLERLPTVLRRTGLSRSTVYRLVAEKGFPAPVQLGARSVAWKVSDVSDWIDSRMCTRAER